MYKALIVSLAFVITACDSNKEKPPENAVSVIPEASEVVLARRDADEAILKAHKAREEALAAIAKSEEIQRKALDK